MGADGSGQRRISFGEGRYSTPVWSPRGDLIAFTKQIGGQLPDRGHAPGRLGRAHPHRGLPQRGPDLGPERPRARCSSARAAGAGGPKLFSIDLTGYNERQVPTPAFGSDPAWSPLRN